MAMTSEELARRLREAREQVGLTQSQAAEAIGLSRSAVTQLESGSRSVSTLELEGLAGLYGRIPADFFSESFHPGETVMTKLRLVANENEMDLLLKAGGWCSRILAELENLENLLDIDTVTPVAPYFQLAPMKSKWKAVQQGELVAREERNRIGIKDEPLPDVSRLLEKQGVRTFFFELPDGVSGLSMMDSKWGFVVIANSGDAKNRRRFSWVHEYGHILMDRDRQATVSRSEDRAALDEVRANAFAAAFLMPDEGVRAAVNELGKGRASRERATIIAGDESPVNVERRSQAGTQALELEDVVRLAAIFGVSRIALLYRLLNLGILKQNDFETLQGDNAARGGAVAAAMGLNNGLSEKPEAHVPRDFSTYLMNLALRAFQHELISRSKLYELAGLVNIEQGAVHKAIEARGAEQPVEAVIPEFLE